MPQLGVRNQAAERNEVQKRKEVRVICLQVKWTLCLFNCLAFDCMRIHHSCSYITMPQ